MAKSKKKIIWVEDEQGLINIYKDVLGKKFDIEFIKLAKTALDKIREIQQGKTEKPDLAIVDLLLPDLNGSVILEEIRKDKITKDIPVFVLTNYGNDSVRQEFPDEMKIDEYLVKTKYSPLVLAELIEKTLK